MTSALAHLAEQAAGVTPAESQLTISNTLYNTLPI
jgi:hypothetical protein